MSGPTQQSLTFAQLSIIIHQTAWSSATLPKDTAGPLIVNTIKTFDPSRLHSPAIPEHPSEEEKLDVVEPFIKALKFLYGILIAGISDPRPHPDYPDLGLAGIDKIQADFLLYFTLCYLDSFEMFPDVKGNYTKQLRAALVLADGRYEHASMPAKIAVLDLLFNYFVLGTYGAVLQREARSALDSILQISTLPLMPSEAESKLMAEKSIEDKDLYAGFHLKLSTQISNLKQSAKTAEIAAAREAIKYTSPGDETSGGAWVSAGPGLAAHGAHIIWPTREKHLASEVPSPQEDAATQRKLTKTTEALIVARAAFEDLKSEHQTLQKEFLATRTELAKFSAKELLDEEAAEKAAKAADSKKPKSQKKPGSAVGSLAPVPAPTSIPATASASPDLALTALRKENAALQKKIAALTAELSTVQTGLATLKSDAERELTTAQAKITAFPAQLQSRKNKFEADLALTKSAHKESMGTLSRDLENKDKTISELQSALTTKSEELIKAQGEIATIETEIQHLKDQNQAELDRQAATLKEASDTFLAKKDSRISELQVSLESSQKELTETQRLLRIEQGLVNAAAANKKKWDETYQRQDEQLQANKELLVGKDQAITYLNHQIMMLKNQVTYLETVVQQAYQDGYQRGMDMGQDIGAGRVALGKAIYHQPPLPFYPAPSALSRVSCATGLRVTTEVRAPDGSVVKAPSPVSPGTSTPLREASRSASESISSASSTSSGSDLALEKEGVHPAA